MKKSSKRFLIFAAVLFALGLLMTKTGKALGGERQVLESVHTAADQITYTGSHGQVYIGEDGIHIGGANGIHIDENGIRIGGAKGITISSQGISVGGLGVAVPRTGVAIYTEDPTQIGQVEEGLGFSATGDAVVTGLFNAVGCFTDLDVDIDLGDIYLICGEQYGVELSYSGEKYSLKWEMDGNTLKVWSESGQGFNRTTQQNAQVLVTIPTGVTLKEVDLSTDLGNVSVTVEEVRCTEAELSTDLGDVFCSGLSAAQLDGESDLGDVTVVFPRTEGVSYQVSTDLGNVDVNGSRWSGKGAATYHAPNQNYYVELHSSLGNVTLNFEG